MIKEKVVILKIPIAEVGQVQYFQIKIPRDAKRIIGMEITASKVLPIETSGGIGGGTSGGIGSPGGGSGGIGGPSGGGDSGGGDLGSGGTGSGGGTIGGGTGSGGLGSGGTGSGGGTGGGTTAPTFGLVFTPSPYLGELRILSCGKANLFYAAEVFQQDANIAQGNFAATSYFPSHDWTHGIKHEEDEVNEEGDATLLKGVFRDRQNTLEQTYTYIVGIYVWYEKIVKAV